MGGETGGCGSTFRWSSLRVDGVDVAPTTLSSANAPGRERWCFLSNQASSAVSVGTHDRALAGRNVIFGPRVPGVRRESAARLWRCFEQAARGRPAERAGKERYWRRSDYGARAPSRSPPTPAHPASPTKHETVRGGSSTDRRYESRFATCSKVPSPKGYRRQHAPDERTERGATPTQSLPRQPRSPRAGPAPRNLSRVSTGRRTSIAVS